MKEPKKTTFIAMAIALTTALVGCATQYVHQRHEAQFLPDPVDSSTPAACRLVLTQDDPFVATKKASPWGQMPYTIQGGLLDMLVTFTMNEALKGENEIANEVRKERASTRSVPLQGHNLGTLFANDIQSSVSVALNSSPWLHAIPLEMSRDNRTTTVAELKQHPVLELRVIYSLSYDASVLIMQSHLIYFKQGETNAEHVRYYTYFSQPVKPEKDEAAVAKWVSADNELLRQGMKEAINETIAMLNADFLRPEWHDPTIPNATVSCFDALIQKQVKWEGHVLRRDGPRILFQEKGGNLFSLIPD